MFNYFYCITSSHVTGTYYYSMHLVPHLTTDDGSCTTTENLVIIIPNWLNFTRDDNSYCTLLVTRNNSESLKDISL